MTSKGGSPVEGFFVGPNGKMTRVLGYPLKPNRVAGSLKWYSVWHRNDDGTPGNFISDFIDGTVFYTDEHKAHEAGRDDAQATSKSKRYEIAELEAQISALRREREYIDTLYEEHVLWLYDELLKQEGAR